MKRRDFLKTVAVVPLIPWAATPRVPLTKSITIHSPIVASEGDLDTISGGVDMGLIWLRGDVNSRPFSVRPGGNVLLTEGASYTLRDEDDIIGLIYTHEDKKWHEISRSQSA